MARIVAYALIFFIAVNVASALKCFRCLASPTSDCAEGVEPSMIVTPCLPVAARNTTTILDSLLPERLARDDEEIETVCIGLSGIDQGISFFERGCGFIWTGVDICEYLSTITTIHSCRNCTNDLCL